MEPALDEPIEWIQPIAIAVDGCVPAHFITNRFTLARTAEAHLRIDGMMALFACAALSGQAPTPAGAHHLWCAGLTANARAKRQSSCHDAASPPKSRTKIGASVRAIAAAAPTVPPYSTARG
jgi:hypothetical protein